MSIGSAAASFVPRELPYTVPLDGTLQSRSLQPLGKVEFNRPYASLSMAKIASTLALPSPNVDHDPMKITALQQLIEALSRPESVSAVLSEGVFVELVVNSSNESAEIRALACQALAIVTKHRAGREFAIAADIVPRLSGLADSDKEKSEAVRRQVLQSFVHMTASAAGIAHLQARGVLRQCIRKLPTEPDLTTHARCLQVLFESVREPAAWTHCIGEGVVDILASVLQSKLSASSEQYRSAADDVVVAGGVVATKLRPLFLSLEYCCQLVAHISAPALAGKDACVGAGMVAMLTSLLPHPVPAIRIASSLSLQNLTNSESGKVASLKAQSIPALLLVMHDEEEMVQCQVMQCITNIAEHPKGKTDPGVVKAVELLKQRAQQHPSQKVRHAAKLAIDQITWQP